MFKTKVDYMLQDPNVERYVANALKPVLKRISELEAEVEKLQQALQVASVTGSAELLPLTDAVKSEVRRLWALPADYDNPPKVTAVKLVIQHFKDNGVECGIKKAKEVIEQHCL